MVDDQTTSPQKIDNIEISADADDDFLLSTLTLHYKSDKAEDYKTLNLEIDPTDGLFHHIIPVQDVIDAEKLEYYFEATNGFNTTTTDVSEVDIQEIDDSNVRSEERRVGKECKSRWGGCERKKRSRR